MGRKVHPKIFRIGHTTDWLSRWFVSKEKMPKLLSQDVKARDFLTKKFDRAGIDSVVIERQANKVVVNIHSARPGVIIGRGGAGIEALNKELKAKVFKRERNLEINIKEIKEPYLSAGVIMEGMISEIERRMPYRRVLKNAINQVQKAGAKGVKLMLAGRLNGAEIARPEKMSWGSVPLQKMRADIDYSFGIARTIYGTIGVKVWIYKGEVFDDSKKDNKKNNKDK